MKTIKEIIDSVVARESDQICKDDAERMVSFNLNKKLWEVMVAMPDAVILSPQDCAEYAERLVVAWWNKKEGISDDAD